MAKTLIFGGAFDPPHKEHVALCKAAMKELGADRLVLVPTYSPPHKSGGFLSFDQRRVLIEKAFDGMDFEIDDIERQRETDNYTCRVLPLLKEKYGDIIYLIGGDSLKHFDSWRDPQDIVKVCPIAAAERGGFGEVARAAETMRAKFGGEFIALKCKGDSTSSSLIRAKLLLGERAEELPVAVMREIEERDLYDDYKPMVDKLRGFQSEELFEHSKAVVKRAAEFDSLHNLKQNFKKLFVAALLHDNAKQRRSIDGLNVPADCVDTPVLHQFLGAEKAKRDFGIDDEEILNAIRYHTTARPDMSLLEKLIYTADSLSDDRTYDPIPVLRAVAIKDFDKGFLATLEYTYDKLAAKGGKIYPLTVQAYRYYIDKQYIDNRDGLRYNK